MIIVNVGVCVCVCSFRSSIALRLWPNSFQFKCFDAPCYTCSIPFYLFLFSFSPSNSLLMRMPPFFFYFIFRQFFTGVYCRRANFSTSMFIMTCVFFHSISFSSPFFRYIGDIVFCHCVSLLYLFLSSMPKWMHWVWIVDILCVVPMLSLCFVYLIWNDEHRICFMCSLAYFSSFALPHFHRTFCQSNSLLFLSVRFALFFLRVIVVGAHC